MFKHRNIYSDLERQKDNQKITILVGARQVGKTTIMRRLYNEFCKEHSGLFLDLDIYSSYEKVSSYEDCLNTLKLNGYKISQNEPFFLFLDEFQRYDDVARVLKNIHDHHPNIKVYASGSSSLAVNNQVQESLAGRKRIVRIYPLNFEEYLHFIDRDDLLEQTREVSEIETSNLTGIIPEVFRELDRFLVYGGYPEVAQVQEKEKKEVLSSIFDLYVKKDLVDFLRIERVKHAKSLIHQLAINHGQETPYSELAKVAAVDEKTAKNYIQIFKETFLLTVHPPYFSNRNKELVKTPKFYFLDNGVRNYFLNNFNACNVRGDSSFLFEAFVISELIKKGIDPEYLKFWRTKNRQEVDLVLEQDGGLYPVEIKYKNQLKSSDFKGLFRFYEHYPQSRGLFLVNLSCNQLREGRVQLLTPFELGKLIK